MFVTREPQINETKKRHMQTNDPKKADASPTNESTETGKQACLKRVSPHLVTSRSRGGVLDEVMPKDAGRRRTIVLGDAPNEVGHIDHWEDEAPVDVKVA